MVILLLIAFHSSTTTRYINNTESTKIKNEVDINQPHDKSTFVTESNDIDNADTIERFRSGCDSVLRKYGNETDECLNIKRFNTVGTGSGITVIQTYSNTEQTESQKRYFHKKVSTTIPQSVKNGNKFFYKESIICVANAGASKNKKINKYTLEVRRNQEGENLEDVSSINSSESDEYTDFSDDEMISEDFDDETLQKHNRNIHYIPIKTEPNDSTLSNVAERKIITDQDESKITIQSSYNTINVITDTEHTELKETCTLKTKISDECYGNKTSVKNEITKTSFYSNAERLILKICITTGYGIYYITKGVYSLIKAIYNVLPTVYYTPEKNECSSVNSKVVNKTSNFVNMDLTTKFETVQLQQATFQGRAVSEQSTSNATYVSAYTLDEDNKALYTSTISKIPEDGILNGQNDVIRVRSDINRIQIVDLQNIYAELCNGNKSITKDDRNHSVNDSLLEKHSSENVIKTSKLSYNQNYIEPCKKEDMIEIDPQEYQCKPTLNTTKTSGHTNNSDTCKESPNLYATNICSNIEKSSIVLQNENDHSILEEDDYVMDSLTSDDNFKSNILNLSHIELGQIKLSQNRNLEDNASESDVSHFIKQKLYKPDECLPHQQVSALENYENMNLSIHKELKNPEFNRFPLTKIPNDSTAPKKYNSYGSDVGLSPETSKASIQTNEKHLQDQGNRENESNDEVLQDQNNPLTTDILWQQFKPLFDDVISTTDDYIETIGEPIDCIQSPKKLPPANEYYCLTFFDDSDDFAIPQHKSNIHISTNDCSKPVDCRINFELDHDLESTNRNDLEFKTSEMHNKFPAIHPEDKLTESEARENCDIKEPGKVVIDGNNIVILNSEINTANKVSNDSFFDILKKSHKESGNLEINSTIEPSTYSSVQFNKGSDTLLIKKGTFRLGSNPSEMDHSNEDGTNLQYTYQINNDNEIDIIFNATEKPISPFDNSSAKKDSHEVQESLCIDECANIAPLHYEDQALCLMNFTTNNLLMARLQTKISVENTSKDVKTKKPPHDGEAIEKSLTLPFAGEHDNNKQTQPIALHNEKVIKSSNTESLEKSKVFSVNEDPTKSAICIANVGNFINHDSKESGNLSIDLNTCILTDQISCETFSAEDATSEQASNTRSFDAFENHTTPKCNDIYPECYDNDATGVIPKPTCHYSKQPNKMDYNTLEYDKEILYEILFRYCSYEVEHVKEKNLLRFVFICNKNHEDLFQAKIILSNIHKHETNIGDNDEKKTFHDVYVNALLEVLNYILTWDEQLNLIGQNKMEYFNILCFQKLNYNPNLYCYQFKSYGKFLGKKFDTYNIIFDYQKSEDKQDIEKISFVYQNTCDDIPASSDIAKPIVPVVTCDDPAFTIPFWESDEVVIQKSDSLPSLHDIYMDDFDLYPANATENDSFMLNSDSNYE